MYKSPIFLSKGVDTCLFNISRHSYLRLCFLFLFLQHVEFRKQMKVDTIITDWKPPEVIEKYVSGGMCGYDREGSPIWYDVIGPLDPKGLLLSATKQDFLKTKIRHIEMLQRECRRQSEKVWNKFSSHILTMYEENYPEGLKRVLLIKGNWQEVLRKHIDPDQLPVVYGGTLTDPDGDPSCRTMVRRNNIKLYTICLECSD
ncbi:hypothetical protein GOODEAATRI_009496 [Goodea atripinnis]|uniref:CRAL-TRIO domain-containing protein n=1 Tax=Goodea atripinnis TaxID=208336 RepID=A0ABV0PM55_9TELE